MTLGSSPLVASDAVAVAMDEVRGRLAEGGIPIGAVLLGPDGSVWGRGHNRRVLLSVGSMADQKSQAPESVMTSILWDMGPR
jgi:hypothetical protein